MPYRSIVVGTDGSATASEAVRHAARLAVAFDAELLIVTAFVSNPAAVARAQQEAPDELRWRITDSAAAEDRVAGGKRVAAEVGATKVRCQVEAGDPAGVLIDVAQDVAADVIVVGSKGMASPARFILGSVPNTVTHHAPCDVLVVHTVD